MKTDLSKLSNDALVEHYHFMKEMEYADRTMDASGDCGDIITKNFAPVWEAFEREFEKRAIQLNDTSDTDMPY